MRVCRDVGAGRLGGVSRVLSMAKVWPNASEPTPRKLMYTWGLALSVDTAIL